MRTPCEITVKKLLPLIRAELSSRLTERGWSQNKIAHKLGVTQAAISGYQKSSFSDDIKNKRLEKVIDQLTSDIVKERINITDFISTICGICLEQRIAGPLCRDHRNQLPELVKEQCRICDHFPPRKAHRHSRSLLITQLRNAIHTIESSATFFKIIPEVRSNIATALARATDKEDVAAIPGRIIKMHHRAFAVGSPEYGASHHLAEVLLAIKKKQRKIQSAICIAYNNEINKIMKQNKIRTINLKREKTKKLVTIIDESNHKYPAKPFAIIDKGGKGIEPITYIFGVNPRQVVDQTIAISDQL